MTVGTEEANRLVVAALAEFMADGHERRSPLFDRLALIGVGLIGCSIARAARAQGAVRSIVATARSAATRRARRRARHRRSGGRDQRRRGRRRRPRHRLHPGRRQRRRRRRRSAPHLQARRDRFRRRLGQGRGAARHGAAHSRRACISFRRIRSPAPRIPARMPASPNCSSTAGASSRRPPDADKAAVEKLAAFWRALGANVETMTAEHHDLVLAMTSHLPHLIAYTIVGTADELGQVTRSEVLQVLRRRLSRFHPHRRLRSDHVARRVPRQQGRGAGNARPLQRGPVRAHARDPPRRRRRAVRSFHPHPRHPPRHRRDRPGFAGARLRPPASASCRTSRCRGLMAPTIDIDFSWKALFQYSIRAISRSWPGPSTC